MPAAFTDAARGVRLQKVLADAGVASRRDCEAMILEGRVKVNGQLIAGLPAWVDPVGDRVAVDDQPIRRTMMPGRGGENSSRTTSKPIPGVGAGNRVYIMLNKPRNVITTTDDPQGRRSVMDLVSAPPGARLFPVGRLDADSTGLILLTNDGELAQVLTHPSYAVPKEYHVQVRGRLTEEDVAILKRGLILAHRAPGGAAAGARSRVSTGGLTVKRASVDQVKLISVSRGKGGSDKTRLSIILSEGQNREIRRLMARLGLNVRRLERVGIGPLRLKGLGPGEYRMLTAREVAALKKSSARESSQPRKA